MFKESLTSRPELQPGPKAAVEIAQPFFRFALEYGRAGGPHALRFAASSVAGLNMPSSVPKWRAREDSNS